MGKRKSSKPQPKKKQEKLSTVFSCPFCNHEATVECRLRPLCIVSDKNEPICFTLPPRFLSNLTFQGILYLVLFLRDIVLAPTLFSGLLWVTA